MEGEVSSARGTGLRQGSVIDAGLFSSALSACDSGRWKALAIVVSQDCDVAADPATEPSVELIAAELVDSPDSGLLHGKHPRQLCLPCAGKQGFLLLDVRVRAEVSKQALDGVPSHGEVTLERGEVRLLARWMGKRYTRDAFPDAFNARWRSAKKKLEQLSKSKEAAAISGVYAMLVHPEDELPDCTDYEVVLWFACPVAVFESAAGRRDANSFARKFMAILKQCEGIRVNPESEVRSHEDISLADLEIMKRFDWDYRSEGVPPGGEVGGSTQPSESGR